MLSCPATGTPSLIDRRCSYSHLFWDPWARILWSKSICFSKGSSLACICPLVLRIGCLLYNLGTKRSKNSVVGMGRCYEAGLKDEASLAYLLTFP